MFTMPTNARIIKTVPLPLPLLTQPASQQVAADTGVENVIDGLRWAESSFTASTIVRASWAILLSTYTNSNEAMFDITLTGQEAEVAMNARHVAGSRTSKVPIHVSVDHEKSVEQLLQQVQRRAVEMTAFEQEALRRNRNIRDEAELGGQFQSLVVVKPAEENCEAMTTNVNDARGLSTPEIYDMMLEYQLKGQNLQLCISFDSNVIEKPQAERMMQQLEYVLRQLCSPERATKLANVETASEQDLQEIWSWNARVPEAVEACVHDLIAETTRRQPEAPAVCAWDGELTYGELDRLSARLAHHLVGLGVGPEVIVPLCFEKSMWTPVAQLAVMKAGGASFAMDSGQPEERLRVMVQQIKPRLILSSFSNRGLASRLTQHRVVVVDETHLQDLEVFMDQKLPVVNPSNTLYLVFTSGSTGIPKGVIITHSNISSAIKYQRHALGFVRTSRIYDFASYMFDVVWCNLLQGLSVGGCLCIPSEDYRRSDPVSGIHKLSANVVIFTPSTVRSLKLSELKDLQTINFIGEPLYPEDFRDIQAHVGASNTYGPSECTTLSTAQRISGDRVNAGSIGPGVGLTTWIVHASNSQVLVPRGSVGELLLEGPLVGQGYLNDPEKTAATFVDDPPWLLRGGPGHPGRRGRLYKTGDLVRYNPDGTLMFIGRKDAQVKIRGQRVELGEVEHHVRRILEDVDNIAQVVAEVLAPQGSDNPTLVAFLGVETNANATSEDDLKAMVQRTTIGLEEKLVEALPTYMIPSAYIPLTSLPVTATGKTDRRRLREIGGSLSLEQLAELNPSRGERRQPNTLSERTLQSLWASVLGIQIESISANDSFLRIGGDSIAAMRLVGAAREQGMLLTVAGIFKSPHLSEMASTITEAASDADDSVIPFSLLRAEIDEGFARRTSALLCGVSADQIEDVFPCTPLQEGLLAETVKRPGKYIARNILHLQHTVDISHFMSAWEEIVTKTPILRTRIVDLPKQGMVQVVIKDKIQWQSDQDLESYIRDDEQRKTGLGTALTRYGLVKNQQGAKNYFVWTMHHALYDGWSMPLLINALKRLYLGEPCQALSAFQPFVQHVVGMDQSSAIAFWQEQFGGLESQQFPALPSPSYQPQADSGFTWGIDGGQWRGGEFTASTIIRAAWAILLATYTDSSEATFGATVTGRQAAVMNVGRMAGPTIATVPIRVSVDRENSVEQLLQQIQRQAVEMTAFEQMGLHRIRRVSPEAERGSQFQTLLVVQPAEEDSEVENELFRSTRTNVDDAGALSAFNTYAIMLECQLKEQGLQLNISFDSAVVPKKQVERMMQQLENVLRQLRSPEHAQTKLANVETVSEQDLQEIWSWNARVPEAVEACVHDLIAETTRRQPEAPAVCAWDGELTYGELDRLSTRLAHHLVGLGVGPEVIVPLCFEKSMWTPVAQLAVMKAGGASFAIDQSQPEERLRMMVQQIKPRLILSSSSNHELASRITQREVVLVDATHLQDLEVFMDQKLPAISPSNKLYLVFTSGSTGIPKGAIVTHKNFCSAIKHQNRAIGISSSSRVYDFVSYAFDVSWSNLLHTFAAGGCLCVPSQTDREHDISGSIRTLGANFAHLTPTVTRFLQHHDIPSLKTLHLSGELLKASLAVEWVDKLKVINSYGPAECTVTGTLDEVRLSAGNEPNIGRGVGACPWVIDRHLGGIVLPLGSVGELWLEGALVGQGYLNDPEKTAAAFVDDPPWLLRGGPGHPGRRGRLYKTGDLVRYNPDGTLMFIGRKDAQVKIRGQRVELGEVEHHVRCNLEDISEIVGQVVAEVLTPQGSDNPTLVAFLGVETNGNATSEDDLNATVQRTTVGLEEKLVEVLPTYMIPSAYIPLTSLPVTATGKTDRRRLREIGGSLSLEQLAELNPSRGERCQPNHVE